MLEINNFDRFINGLNIVKDNQSAWSCVSRNLPSKCKEIKKKKKIKKQSHSRISKNCGKITKDVTYI